MLNFYSKNVQYLILLLLNVVIFIIISDVNGEVNFVVLQYMNMILCQEGVNIKKLSILNAISWKWSMPFHQSHVSDHQRAQKIDLKFEVEVEEKKEKENEND